MNRNKCRGRRRHTGVTARQKLNTMNAYAVVVIAAVVGVVFQSWGAFFLAVAALGIGGLLRGDFRFDD